jgi:ribonuclease-3
VSDDRARGDARHDLETRLGHRFRDRSLLERALTHSSFAHEAEPQGASKVESNERLEFLGDAVLGFAVASALYRAKPEWREGDLTRASHSLVDGRSLEKLARALELGPELRLGRTEAVSGGGDKASILENAMEAVIGAIYLDGGLEAAAAFVERVFGEALAADAARARRDPKTELQERVMAVEGEFPRYRVVADTEIEGDPSRFRVEAFLGDRVLAAGVGRSKRAAERAAAKAALAQWRADHPVEA